MKSAIIVLAVLIGGSAHIGHAQPVNVDLYAWQFPTVSNVNPQSELVTMLQQEVSQILAHVGLSDAAYKVPGQLSGGMRRRASLARALVGNPKLVLLDDPTFGLDPIASAVIMNLIVEFQRKRDVTMLVVSQDLRRLLPICTRIWGLFDGQMRFSGTRDELRGSPDEILRQLDEGV